MHSGRSGALVGRERPLVLISSLLDEVAAGRGGVVLVQGEPGIGKSALLAAGMTDGRQRGLDVRDGVCDELGRRLPLSVLQQALGDVFGPGRDRADAEGGTDAAAGTGSEADTGATAATASEPGTGATTATTSDTGAAADRSTAEGVRDRHSARVITGDPVTAAAEELLVLVDRLCAARPLVLVLDDLQWADEATLLVWRRLCRTAAQRPLLLIGACRPVPQRPELDLLRRDVRDHAGTTLTLDRLSDAEVAELARRIAGRVAGPRLLGRLGAATGNPLYVREIMDALGRAGALEDMGAVKELADAAPARDSALGGPVDVERMSLAEAIADRLAFLTIETRDMLRTGALLGPAFPITDLTVLLGRPAASLTAPVQEAMAAGVLEPAEGNRLRFRHALLRQALYESVPAALRVALHRDAAQTLIARGSSVERVAELLLAAIDAADGWETDWLVDNAAGLVRRAPDAAATLFEHALAHVDEDDPRTPELLDHLASAAFLAGHYDRAGAVARRVLDRHGDSGRADPEQRGRAAWILGYTLLRTARIEDAYTTAQKVAAGLEPDTRWHARLRAFSAMVLTSMGRTDEAAREADSVLAVGARLSDSMSAAYARHTLAMLRFQRQDMEGALDHLAKGIALTGSDPELLDLRLLMQTNQIPALLDLDRFAQAREALSDARARAERTGTPRLSSCVMHAGDVAFHTGHWDDALTELDTISDPDHHPTYFPALPVIAHGIAAVIAAHRDELTVARHHLSVLEELPDIPFKTENFAYYFQARAMVAERSNDLPAAVRGLRETLVPSYDVMDDRARLLPLLVRLALAAGDRDTAERAVACVEAEAARGGLPRVTAARAWCQGLLRGDPAGMFQAVDHYRRVGRTPEAAQALEDAAELLAATGRTDEARRTLNDAMLAYTGLGAAWDSRRAAARLRAHGVRLGVRGARGRPRTGWKALTDTELRIADLVAEGRSNPDIAEDLVLSRRTVETHVSHILVKLGVKSRREVARLAETHGR